MPLMPFFYDEKWTIDFVRKRDERYQLFLHIQVSGHYV